MNLREHEQQDEQHVESIDGERLGVVKHAQQREQQRLRVGAAQRVVQVVAVAVQQQVEQQRCALLRQL